MGSPTIAENHAILKAAVDVCEELRKFASVNAANFVGKQDTLEQALEGDRTSQIASAAQAMRLQINGALGAARALLEPIFMQYGKIIGAPETDVQGVISRFIDYCIANTITFKTRAMTFGSVTAVGSPAGNGVIYRCTKDAYDYDIESVFADTKTAKVIADQNSGAEKHEEVWQVRGGVQGPDLLALAGSGLVLNDVRCVSARNSLLSNPSFEKYEGTTSVPTAITGWLVSSSFGNFEIDESNYYRGFPGSTLQSGVAGSASLKIKGNDTIYQTLSTARVRAIDPRVPYWFGVPYNRQIGSGDGTLTIHMGTKTASVSLAAQTGWNMLYIGMGDENYLRNFNEQDLDIKIQLASRTTGYVLVDDAILVPMYQFGAGGDFILPVGGSTPWLRDDSYTWADTETGSKIQEWVRRAFLRYLPHASSPSVTDP